MKKTFKICLFVSMLIILLVGGTVFAKDTEYVVEKKIIFQNSRNYTLKNIDKYVIIALGQIDITSYADDVYLKVTPKPDMITQDEYGNLYANYDINGMLPKEKLTITIERRVKSSSFESEEPILARSNGSVTEENKLYVVPQKRVESDNVAIINKANELTQNLTSDYRKASAIFEYVNTQMNYNTNYVTSNEKSTNKGALAALTTNNLNGVCEEFATLFAAMCRAEEIPTRLIAGYKVQESNGVYELIDHLWAEIYLDDYGWLPVDPTVIYTVDGSRATYWKSFCAIESPEYIPTGIYNIDAGDIVYTDALNTLSSDGKILGANENIVERTLEVGKQIKEPKQNSFSDISMHTWAQSSIQELYARDIVEGYSETEYGPDRNISVIEFICMLSRTLSNLNENHVDKANIYYYPSYNQNHWSKDEYDFLMKCYQFYTPSDMMSAGFNNIVDTLGVNINIDRPITRGEVVGLMSTFLKDPVTSNSFSDTRNSKFANSIEKAYSFGIIEGYPDGTFRPNGYITRAEMATILGRFIANNMYVQ